MRLIQMTPSPFTAAGESFLVICCGCGCPRRSTEVLCDADGKTGDFYCTACVKQILEGGDHA